MFASLTGRLTLMYLGAAFALLIIEIVAGAWSEVVEFHDNVNLTIRPALNETTEMMTQQRRVGRTFTDAATFAVAHLSRQWVRVSVFDDGNREVLDGTSQGSAEALAVWALDLLGTPTLDASVPGGRVVVSPNATRLVYWVSNDFMRMIPSMLFAIAIAYLLARLIASAATRPLKEIESALRSLSRGDFVPKPIVAGGSSEIARLTAEYNAAAAEVQRAINERDEATESTRRFIAEAGHELKTPLTIIIGYVDAVSEGLVTDPRDSERVLKKTLGECRRMRATIDKLLSLARLDRDVTDACTLDVATLVRQVAETMKPLAQELHVEVPLSGGAFALADESELREALENIIENAVKYAPGSPIDVRVTTTVDVIIVEIADAGPGMSPADREHAFERFHRGSSQTDVEGSGLGLAIAKRAVQRANGRITLSSELGRGTTVKIYLPVLSTAVA